MDWSIKTRTRFVSTKSFKWTSHLSTVAQSCGTASFVRGGKVDLQPYLSFNPKGNTQQSDMSCKSCCEFFKSLFYYCYPGVKIPHGIQEALRKMSIDAEDFSELGDDKEFMDARVNEW